MKILVIDSYFLLDQILRFVEDGHEVYFYNVLGSTGKSLLEEVEIYYGLDKYFTRVDDYGKVIDKVDLVYFTDMYFPDLANKLKEDGVPVYGPTPELTKMEDIREYGREEMKKLGIRVPEAEVIEGLENLQKYLNRRKGKAVIKLDSRYRGNAETFIVEGYEDALMQLGSSNLGPFLKDMKFFVQEFIEGVEIGADMFISGDKMVLPYGYTLEIKLEGGSKGNIGVWSYKEGSIREFFSKMLPKTEKDDYHCNISYEAILTKKGPYVLEPTSRNPYPVFGLYARFLENYSDVIYGVASGKIVNPVYDKKNPIMGQVVVFVGKNVSSWSEVEIEEGDPLKNGVTMKDGFGFNRVVVKDNKYWVLPGEKQSVTLNVYGSDIDEIIEKGKYYLDKISATNLYYYPRIFREMKRRTKELEEYDKDFHFEVGSQDKEVIEIEEETPRGELDLTGLKKHLFRGKNYTAIASYEGEKPNINFSDETGEFVFRGNWDVIYDSSSPDSYGLVFYKDSSLVLENIKKASLENRSILRTLENILKVKVAGVVYIQESYIDEGVPHIRDIIALKMRR